MKPRATIMIPAYNTEKFIGNTLESAMNQTYKKPYEILVVNDGSTDDTQGKIEWYQKKDNRIRLINQENKGIAKTRNVLLNNSSGKYLFGLDSDDLLHPESLKKVTDYFNSFPKTGFVYTNHFEIGESSKINREVKKDKVAPFLEDLIYNTNFVGHLRAYDREKIKGAQFDPYFEKVEDYQILLDLSNKVEIGFIPKSLYYYTINSNGISKKESNFVKEKTIELLTKYISKNIFNGGKDFSIEQIRGDEYTIYNWKSKDKESLSQNSKNKLIEFLEQNEN